MDSVHHIWCPLFSQEFQDLPDGAETTLTSDELERKIIRLFALGMSYQDISREIEDLYAFSVSTATISAVTDKVIPELKQWQQRPLEKVYPFVWLDAIHYKILSLIHI